MPIAHRLALFIGRMRVALEGRDAAELPHPRWDAVVRGLVR